MNGKLVGLAVPEGNISDSESEDGDAESAEGSQGYRCTAI